MLDVEGVETFAHDAEKFCDLVVLLQGPIIAS